jgi:hypothetical protein
VRVAYKFKKNRVATRDTSLSPATVRVGPLSRAHRPTTDSRNRCQKRDFKQGDKTTKTQIDNLITHGLSHN